MHGRRRLSVGLVIIVTTMITLFTAISPITPVHASFPNTIVWAGRAPMPCPRAQASVIGGLDGRIYVMGGYSIGSPNYTPNSTSFAYDPRTDSWSTIASLPIATRGAGTAIDNKGLIYVIGGTSGTSNQIYNVTSNSWTTGTSMSTYAWEPGVTAGSDGRIYVAGGEGATTALQIYNPQTKSWTSGAPMSTARKQFQLVAAPNGLLYAIGGMTGSNIAIATVEAYNITANSWASKASLPSPVNSYGATLGSDGLIYVFGGSNYYVNNMGPFYNTVYSYYPATDTWYTNTQTLPTARREDSAATSTYNNRMYVIGGANGTFLRTNEEATVSNGHPTTTKVTCSPAMVGVNNSTSCTAIVIDNNSTAPTTPTGTVTFQSSGSGTFSGTCSLTGTGNNASCTTGVTYTPTAIGTGTHVIRGTYLGDSTHNPSISIGSQSFTLTVIGRLTSTVVSCAPSSVLANNGSTCTATVADTGSGTTSTPTGTARFTSAGTTGGSFSPATNCNLSTGSCSVTFTPSGAGTVKITASYQGDNVHYTSSGISGNLTSTLRTSTIAISCPTTTTVNNPVSCTVTVTDTSPAPALVPSGTVALSSSGPGTFTSCTLAGSVAAATCATSYKPTSIGTGSHVLTAHYGGDMAHSPPSLNATATLRITRLETSMVTCTAPATIGVATTCTVTVTDASPGTFVTPTGTVALSTNGSGTFAGTCILSGTTAYATCTVTYTPGGTSANNDVISYSYPGDTNHTASSGNFQLVVVPPASPPPSQTTGSAFLGLQTIYWIILVAALAGVGVFFGYFMVFKKRPKHALQPTSAPGPAAPSGIPPPPASPQ
jgi:N-acetylneuraminic acid mutarotase